jgi:tetratricopeptide (TPR) repeat protein
MAQVLDWHGRVPPRHESTQLSSELLLQYERCCEMIGAREEQQRVIDRLIILLEPGSDRAAFGGVLLRQGELLTIQRRFDEAHDALSRALAIRRDLGDRFGERQSLISIGFCRWHQGRYDEAVSANEAALAIDRIDGAPDRIATTLTNLGSILRGLHEHEQALRYLAEAREIYAAMPSRPRGSTYTLQITANVHRDVGDNTAAMACLVDALALERELRMPLQEAFTLGSAAMVLLDQGRADEALGYLRESLDVSRRIAYAHGILHSLRSLSDTLLGLDRAEDALGYLPEAIDLSLRLNDEDAAVRLMMRMAGILERHPRRAAEATAVWEHVHASCIDRRDNAGALNALRALARLARHAGDDVRASEARYEEALHLAEAIADRPAQASILNTLGILAWSTQRDDLAIGRYEAARSLLRDDPANLALVLNSLAACHVRLGHHDEAVVLAREAADASRLAEQPMLEGYALAIEGDAHMAECAFTRASECYGVSLTLRRQLQDRRGEGWMLERLSRCAAAAGDTDQAMAFLNAATGPAESCGDAALLEACRALRRTQTSG